jgi:very-short-patch-repair endonuclease
MMVMVEETHSRRRAGATERARGLRRAGNIAEARLWNELKDRRLGGHKFVRQFPIGPYIADFACRDARLVVEVDGSQHAGRISDRMRDEYMCSRGFSVIRFWNTDVLAAIGPVCETIRAALDGRLAENTVAYDLRYVRAKPE